MSAFLVSEEFVQQHTEDAAEFLAQATLKDVWLQGAKFDVELTDAVTTWGWKRSILAPTELKLTLYDPEWELRNKFLPADDSEQAMLHLGKYEFGVVRHGGNQRVVSLTAEDAPATFMRRYNKRRKSGGKQTLAEFQLSLMREVIETDIPVFCPIIGAKAAPVRGKAAGKVPTHRSLSPSDGLTVKGDPAEREQLRFMTEVLIAAEKYSKNNFDAMVCCIMCIITENEARNEELNGDHDSVGGFAQRKSQGWKGNLKDPDREVKNFLLDAPTVPLMTSLRHRGGRTLGQLVQATQVSAKPAEYDKHKSEAIKAVKAFKGGDKTNIAAAWTRGQGKDAETTWQANSRMSEAVNWRFYSDMGLVVLADELALLAAAPAIEINPNDEMFDVPDYEVDWGMPLASMTVVAHDLSTPIAPGLGVRVSHAGIANGNWLIESIDQDAGEDDQKLNLRRPGPAKPAPSESRSKSGKTGSKIDDRVQRLFEAAKAISDNTPGYLLGGGHGPAIGQLNSHMKMDCSSSTSYALYKAGLFDRSTAIVSGEFARSYGRPGKGRWVTIWANADHVWIQMIINGVYYRLDTGGPGGGRGPKLSKERRSTAGFTPRHPKDL